MKKRHLLTVTVIAFGGVALAHNGVQNPDVMARMNGMSALAQNMKTLGNMVKGVTPFVKTDAQNAATNIAQHASETAALFQANEDDPKSEAKPEIWTNFDDFTQKAGDLETIALEVSETLSSKADLGPAMAKLGAACKACHATYRE